MDEGKIMASLDPTEPEKLAAENAQLRAVISAIDAALCNYLNGCSDPYTPVSKWDDESRTNFRRLCAAYNAWHNTHDIDFCETK